MAASDNGTPLPFDSQDHHDAGYFNQLRRKLRWQLLAAYLIPLLLLAAFFHYQYNETLRHGIDTHLKSVAENKRNAVSLFLQERVANTASAFHFEGLPAPPSAAQMQRMLAELKRESSAFVDLGLFNPEGVLVAYAGPFPSLLGKNYSQENWLKRLRSSERSYHISDVFSGFRGRPHFIIAVRREVTGEQWTLRASVDPERFGELVSKALLMKHVEAFIVNPAGIRQTASSEGTLSRALSFVPAPSYETQVLELSHQGEKLLTALAWLAEADWALVVRIPTRIAYAPLRSARLWLSGLMLVLLALIVFFTSRSTNRIVARLEAADRGKDELRQQLFNAAKLASVGEMAAGVAHEINNPLAIIYEEAGAMKDTMDPRFGQTIDPADFAERLDAIKEATLRGRTITGKLLAFARRHEPDPEPTDLNALADKVLSIKGTEFKVSNIAVVREFDPELPLMLVSPNQLEQVLLNLLNNAKDAIDGSGRITLRTERGAHSIRIAVQDSGCGMEKSELAKIFFPFFTTKSVGKGTGLGLSISYGIIKALGGQIEVQSKPQVGSTFTIVLPLSLAQEKELPHDPAAQVAGG